MENGFQKCVGTLNGGKIKICEKHQTFEVIG